MSITEQLEREIREHKAQHRALLTEVYYAPQNNEQRAGIWEQIEYYETLIKWANEEIERQETDRRIVLALAKKSSDELIEKEVSTCQAK